MNTQTQNENSPHKRNPYPSIERTSHCNNCSKLNIALVSDFFFPNKGGVETHIRRIGEELYNLGHNVIVITHSYYTPTGVYKGVKKIGNLVVYYLDIPILANNDTYPTLFCNFILFGEIFKRHAIDIVHGHQSLSNMCLEAIYHASNMNIKTVMTDHSVFEIAKFERVIVNSLSKFICKNLDWMICVSKASKENTHLRIGIPLDRISVIPNGIDPERFNPTKPELLENYTKVNKEGDYLKENRLCEESLILKQGKPLDESFIRNGKNRFSDKEDKIKILVMSRLTFRKGIDLLIDSLPLICQNKNFSVFIVGDGPKRAEILQTIDENDLHEQVTLVGEICYEDVPAFLRSGDIFLNTSLTETFCLAILEAAACGLTVVSTNVGGIHEVLDPEDIYFCEPNGHDISRQIKEVAASILNKRENRNLIKNESAALYEKIARKYDWKNIAKEIESVYISIPNKRLGFETVLKQFPGVENILCRFATFLEFLQIGFFKKFNKK